MSMIMMMRVIMLLAFYLGFRSEAQALGNCSPQQNSQPSKNSPEASSYTPRLLGGSWVVISRVISPPIILGYKYSCPTQNPTYNYP